MVESELENFKKVRESNDADQIRTAMEDFTQKVYQAFGKVYQQTAGQQQPGSGPDGAAGSGSAGSGENSDGTVDADYDVK